MMRTSRVAALIAAVGALSAASNAYAADCNFASAGANIVYVTGSSASSPYLAALSKVLAAQATPVTLVYIQTESCQGVTDFLTPTPVTAAATYWTANPDGGAGIVANTCNFSATSTPATQVTVDASVSDVFASTCPNTTLDPAKVKEIGGPIQAMTFIVNPSSTAVSISEEAAHVVFKDIATASQQISPWTDAAHLYIRQGGANGSGTRAMIGKELGFADSDWSAAIPTANVFTSSGSLLAAVAGDTANASKTLGILTVQKTDVNRPGSSSTQQVRVLPYQAKGQSCGYLPDSTKDALDKINVREGRYNIWGPLHFITAINGSGAPVSSQNPGGSDAAVQAFVNLVSLPAGATLTTDQKKAVIAASASAHVVAQCAMRVQRSGEVSGEASFVPAESCGCYWESVATGSATPAGCTACPGGTECASLTATPVCRYGFCEAQ